jgi:hypothetical protein
METDNNYNGYAIMGKGGKLEAVSSYKSVGMYQPCLYVENGIATSLLVGGFKNANGTPINKKVDVLVQEHKWQ